MKLLFAPDTSDHPNWGCRVMGTWFRAALARNNTPAKWNIGSQWFYRKPPGLPHLTTMAHFRHYAAEVKAGKILPDISAMLRECDLVFLNGENFIRPDTLKGRMLLFVAYLAKTVFNKPCVLTNHSVDLEEPALAEIAHEVYPLLDEVHFREETSVKRYSHLVAPGRWQLIPDVAWTVPAAPLAEWQELAQRQGQFCAWPDTAENFNPLRPYITVCASSVFSIQKLQSTDTVPAFIKLCRRLNEEVGPVVLTAPCEPDTKIMRKVQTALSLPLLGIHLPVRQAIDIIGNAAVHIGGRWHLAIFAATGGTPSIALSASSHKMDSLMRQIGMDDPVFDVLQLEKHIDEIVALAQAHIKAGTGLRTRLLQRSRELGAQVDRNMDYVKRQAERLR